MAKARMVSSRIATDPRLAALSCSTARLLYVTMITLGDALGRLRGEPAYVRQAAIPNEPDVTDRNVARWLEEMVGQKLIDWYEVDGERYIRLLGWSTYGSLCQQRLDRAKQSDFPDPRHPVTSTDGHRWPEGEDEGEGESEGLKQQRSSKRKDKRELCAPRSNASGDPRRENADESAPDIGPRENVAQEGEGSDP